MSGNMSFLNNNSGTRRANSNQPILSSTARDNDNPGHVSRGSRGSTSFRDGSSILSSFVEEEDESKIKELESLCDKDVWGNRFILSALADIVFSEIPHPKLPPDVIQGLQKFLLSVNVATSACNPFVEYEKYTATIDADDVDANSSSTSKNDKKRGVVHKLELPRELIEGLTPECKVVLKSLIGTYVRKQIGKIREFWKPILEIKGITLPPAFSDPSSVSAGGQRRSVGSGAAQSDEGQLQELFNLILNQAKIYQTRSQVLDEEVEELLKKRNEEMRKYERDVNKLKELTLQTLKEQKAEENPDFGKKYMEYLNLETERVNQQIRLENLKVREEEQGTEEEQKERQELYSQVKKKFELMLQETEEMEEQLEKYKSLGPDYMKLLEEYKNVDEDVKLKEWVVEQLANGPKDESLFNDSFTD